MPIVPFKVDFAGKTAEDQARKILDRALQEHQNGASKVGITYSATQQQTDHIIDSYKKGKWQTGTSGANQAAVMAEVERLLAADTKYKSLQKGVFQIVPITTMKYKGSTAVAADDSSVAKSLAHADQFMASGGTLLGWTNEHTSQGKLAIGGGVAANVQTPKQKHMINDWVQKNLPTSPTLGPTTSGGSIPLAPPKKTSSGSDSMSDLMASEAEAAKLKRQSVYIQSEHLDNILPAYQKFCKEKGYKEGELPEPKTTDENANLSFKSPEDVTDFFKKQAEDKQPFIMVDEKTNQVIAFSNGDGKLYRPGKDGPQEITGKSLYLSDSEKKDLPELKDFKLPSKTESSSNLQV